MFSPVFAVFAAVLCCAVGFGRPLVDSTLNVSEIVWSAEQQHRFIGSPTLLRPAANTSRLLAAFEYFDRGPKPLCSAGLLDDLSAPAPAAAFAAVSAAAGGVHQPPSRRLAADVAVTYVYASDNDGVDWYPVASVPDMHFATLFQRPNDSAVYVRVSVVVWPS